MSLSLYNTLTRRPDAFEPLEPGRVRMYTCGPTVHDFAHIGNFRAYAFEDLLRRFLKYSGYQVTQVMNLTDVDDKTIRKSRTSGLSLKAYTQKYAQAFFEDLKALNIEPAEVYPAATDHIPEMIALIERLFAAGVAYRSDDGSVYFSIAKYPRYGQLARLDREGMRPGARVAQDEYEKDNVGDFALWKAWDEEDGDVAWDSPWGRGRPGWHIECSAMSMKYLGESFDIHTGGEDNIFPHHEDEIAQSEAATGKPFARFWLHCKHLMVDGRKMSKSLNNFFTLRDLGEQGWHGREIRYVLIATHYRQTLNFTIKSLQDARTALARIDEFRGRLAALAGAAAPAKALPEWAAARTAEFRAALADDLNASGALGVLFELVHAGNKALDEGGVDAATAAAVQAMLDDWDRVLGLLAATAADIPAEIRALLDQRAAARKARVWAESDRIRDHLATLGWIVQDTPAGQKIRKA